MSDKRGENDLFLTIKNNYYFRYREDGHTRGEAEFQPPNPIRLQWDIPQEVIHTYIPCFGICTIYQIIFQKIFAEKFITHI